MLPALLALYVVVYVVIRRLSRESGLFSHVSLSTRTDYVDHRLMDAQPTGQYNVFCSIIIQSSYQPIIYIFCCFKDEITQKAEFATP